MKMFFLPRPALVAGGYRGAASPGTRQRQLGSHRYATLNMGGESEQHLKDKFVMVKQTMGFETG